MTNKMGTRIAEGKGRPGREHLVLEQEPGRTLCGRGLEGPRTVSVHDFCPTEDTCRSCEGVFDTPDCSGGANTKTAPAAEPDARGEQP
ncbi:MAG: hypothetical protein OXR67_08035 [Chloroflexota bacterium]|nr:hypothetical protein [Chloroflexota bacterium]